MAGFLTIDNSPTQNDGNTHAVYTGLSDPSKEIRVLDLEPGKHNDDIHATLRTVLLSTEPSYAALSYTWGAALKDEEDTDRPTNRVRIRPNLHSALRNLRQRRGKRTIWIDAICINQDDPDEKAVQIGNMGAIYQSAATVLIWLGDYPGAQSHDVQETREPHWNANWREWVGLKSSSRRLNARGRKFAAVLESTLATAPIKWQDRAWVIQEFALARAPMLCFGPVSVPFDKVHLQDLTEMLDQPMPNLLAFYHKIADLYRMRIGLRDGRKESIHQVLPHVSAAECYLSQDKVYSLMSLIDERESEMLPIDSKQTVEQLFARTTFAAVVAQESLVVLDLVKLSTATRDGLPSWAVDFSLQHNPIDGRLSVDRREDYIDWSKQKLVNQPFARLTSDAKLLCVTGSSFSTIASTLVVPGKRWERSDSVTHPFAGEMAAFLLDLCSKHYTGLHGSTAKDSALACGTDLLISNNVGLMSIIEAGFAIWDDFNWLSNGRQDADHTMFSSLSTTTEKWTRLLRVGTSVFMGEYVESHTQTFKVFATNNGYLGTAAANVEAGDHVVFLAHSPSPVVLRARGDELLFHGFAWVHGMMNGKAEGFLSQEEMFCIA